MYNPLTALLLFAIGAGTLAVCLWPDWGLWHRLRRAQRHSERVLTEDALKHVYFGERNGRRATLSSLAGDLEISVDRAAQLATGMEQGGLVEMKDGAFGLTLQGREAALHIVRAHRLWERYLADRTGYAEPEWHHQAEQAEHELPPDRVDALAAELGNPTYDPHGDPIPMADGAVQPPSGRSLGAFEAGDSGRIVHIEDEPEVIYSQLVAEGLYPGMEFQILEQTPQRIRFWAEGDEHILAPLLADNITGVLVSETAVPVVEHKPAARLSGLKPGEAAEVESILRACHGSERRRLMDLGILPGTRIQAAFTSPTNDPTAYLVRDTLIALRHEQADLISIRRLEAQSAVRAAAAA